MSDEVLDEVAEGVWGYLVPLDPRYGDKPLVLKRRNACPLKDSLAAAAALAATSSEPDDDNKQQPATIREEEAYELTKIKGVASGGYLIGRHPECGRSQASPSTPLILLSQGRPDFLPFPS